MRNILLLLMIGTFFVSCDVPGFTTKEVIQDFSTMSDEEIIAKYGEPKNSKWEVKSFTISKIRFENMNNTTFENINLSGSKLDEETGFKGTIEKGSPYTYTLKMGNKSEVVYNKEKKLLRVSLEER